MVTPKLLVVHPEPTGNEDNYYNCIERDKNCSFNKKLNCQLIFKLFIYLL
jgi:hypothetical protein